MIPTTIIRGRIVLAKDNCYAKTFANYTQAQNAAIKSGGEVWKPANSRPWFVVIESKEATQ